jgi:PHP family Zn ribbon phosphoesterase
MKVGVNSKRVQGEYRRVVQEMGSEFRVLIQASHNDLTRLGGEPLAQAVIRARTGKVRLEPGYDGVFGSVSVSPARVSPSGEEAGWNDGQGC